MTTKVKISVKEARHIINPVKKTTPLKVQKAIWPIIGTSIQSTTMFCHKMFNPKFKSYVFTKFATR